jgi:hypothetical protein
MRDNRSTDTPTTRAASDGTALAAARGAFLLTALAACGAPAGMVASGAATGDCLGRLCLGMTESEALAALDANIRTAGTGELFCVHLADAGLDLSFRVAADGSERRVASILATTLPHCGDAGGGPEGDAGESGGDAGAGAVAGAVAGAAEERDASVRDMGAIADCRGVQPGDPEAFVAKVHRRAGPVTGTDPIWAGTPAGVRALVDHCEPAVAGGPETRLYLRDGRVVGLAVRRP